MICNVTILRIQIIFIIITLSFSGRGISFNPLSRQALRLLLEDTIKQFLSLSYTAECLTKNVSRTVVR